MILICDQRPGDDPLDVTAFVGELAAAEQIEIGAQPVGGGILSRQLCERSELGARRHPAERVVPRREGDTIGGTLGHTRAHSAHGQESQEGKRANSTPDDPLRGHVQVYGVRRERGRSLPVNPRP